MATGKDAPILVVHGAQDKSTPVHSAQRLNQLFQEAGIPPWIRERVPLIYLDAQLAAVGGFWVAAEVWTPAGLAPVWQAPPGLTLARPHPGMAATLADQQR